MYTKFFFERFWEGEQRNELFVCMPFHDLFDSRFNNIISPAAKEAGFDNAVRVKEDSDGNVVMTKIQDGIANSKMILIDLTNDPKYPDAQHTNGNVLYEAGIANAMREPSSIVMIRDQDPSTADFDVSGLTINTPKDHELKKDWLTRLLKTSLENHSWTESKRVKAATESIDDIGLYLMCDAGRLPKGWNHFNTLNFKPLEKISVLRLIDLGILWFNTGGLNNPTEHAYHWTSFGYEVMKLLGIKQLTMGEFEKMPEYEVAKKTKEKYKEEKRRLKNL